MTDQNPYILVLTHDVDVLSLRELPWRSRTLWGFLFRCIYENLLRMLRGRISCRQYLIGLGAAASVLLVKSGLATDPIEKSFRIMLDIEKRHRVRSTLFFISKSGSPGKTPLGHLAPENRAAYYRVEDFRSRVRALENEGWEIGVHGIDAYRDPEAARRELWVLSQILGHGDLGHRAHWLYSKGRCSWRILRDAGFAYDASLGSNSSVGWPDGARGPFRPFDADRFAVLPLNIQDGALLDRSHMDLDSEEAWRKISILIQEAKKEGAALTVLWHTHSFWAPRFWSGLYEKLILQARADGAVIVPAREALGFGRGAR